MADDQHQNLPEQSQPETRRYAIREGAGLDESRLNRDFIDALQKYGVWVLIIAAVALGAYNGWTYLEKKKTESRQTAFADLSGAMEAGSPDNLVKISVLHEEHGAVSILGRLQAADLYLAAYRTGLAPGAQLSPEGKPASDADVLNEEQRAEQLAKAEEQYRAVYGKAKANKDYALHTIGSLFGLAAVAESRGKLDEAKNFYSEIVTVSESAQLPLPGQTAKARLETIDTLGETPKLYDTTAVLALKPPEPEPQPVPAGGTTNPDGTVSIPGLPEGLTPVNPEDVPADVREQQGQPVVPQPEPAPAPAGEPSSTP